MCVCVCVCVCVWVYVWFVCEGIMRVSLCVVSVL